MTLQSQALHSPKVFKLSDDYDQEIRKITKRKLKKIARRHKKDFITSGKGVWVNVWNYPETEDTKAFIKRLDKFDIDTIYLQINRSTTEIFKNKDGVDQILLEAHKKNINVIGWSYCYLNDVDTDSKKFYRPARYVSPHGEMLDGMAADIEENTSLSAVRKYTHQIKEALPEDYPLIAIVYSPKIKTKYPWEFIANNWDVLMPMTYWHSLKARKHDDIYNFVKDSIVQLRKLTKKKDLNIHMITDGDRTNAYEVKASIEAARDLGVNAGISIYPEHLATDGMLEMLKKHCDNC